MAQPLPAPTAAIRSYGRRSFRSDRHGRVLGSLAASAVLRRPVAVARPLDASCGRSCGRRTLTRLPAGRLQRVPRRTNAPPRRFSCRLRRPSSALAGQPDSARCSGPDCCRLLTIEGMMERSDLSVVLRWPARAPRDSGLPSGLVSGERGPMVGADQCGCSGREHLSRQQQLI
jgi:hypothetical protein